MLRIAGSVAFAIVLDRGILVRFRSCGVGTLVERHGRRSARDQVPYPCAYIEVLDAVEGHVPESRPEGILLVAFVASSRRRAQRRGLGRPPLFPPLRAGELPAIRVNEVAGRDLRFSRRGEDCRRARGGTVANALSRSVSEEIFGSLGITVRTFVDPEKTNRVGLIAEIPDMAAFQAMMASQAGADAMKFDGVRPGTLL